MKTRFKVLIVLLLAMLVFSAVYIFMFRDEYTLKYDYFQIRKEITPDMISVSFSNDNILKLDNIFVDRDNTICIEVSSLNPGEVIVLATADIFEEPTPLVQRELRVSKSGMIFETIDLNFNGSALIRTIIFIWLFLFAIVLAVSYFEDCKNGRFSYSTVSYGGVSLFSFAVLVLSFHYSQFIASPRTFISIVMETGYYFVIIATIPMLVVSILISISNIWLVMHEGFRPVNLLGFALGLFSFVGSVFIIFGRNSTLAVKLFGTKQSAVFLSLSYSASLLECIFMFIMLTAAISTKYKPSYDKDYLMILGCGIRDDGSLTPLLKGRVDSAINFEKEQFESTGKHAKFIPSGGQGPDEVISESEAMKRYLLEQGIPEDRILMEDKSVNTWQNIGFSKKVIEKDAGSADGVKTAFATTNYHIFRGYTLSAEHKLDAQGISAKTKWYFFPNAFLREFVGLLAARKWQILLEIVIITAVLVFCESLLGSFWL